MKNSPLILLMLLTTPLLFAQTVITYRTPESKTDSRYDYDTAVLDLALQKTVDSYGDYRLVPSPRMNFGRTMNYLKNNELENLVVKLSYSQSHPADSFSFAAFPIDLGIVGFRVCFISDDIKEELSHVDDIQTLKKYTHGQGVGWSDIDILRTNGMQVKATAPYASLFKMVALNRFDLFCRGANELLDEYQVHKNIPKLSYDEHFSLVYPLPRFFYSNSANKKVLLRIEQGLIKAHADGSLQTLWWRHYGDSIRFSKLEKRILFRLDNPLLEGLDESYQQYFFNPLQEPN